MDFLSAGRLPQFGRPLIKNHLFDLFSIQQLVHSLKFYQRGISDPISDSFCSACVQLCVRDGAVGGGHPDGHRPGGAEQQPERRPAVHQPL